MNLGIAAPSTGTPTKAADLTVGQRVLIGVDTKAVLAVTRDGDTVKVKARLAYGKTGYYKFPATRTLFAY